MKKLLLYSFFACAAVSAFDAEQVALEFQKALLRCEFGEINLEKIKGLIHQCEDAHDLRPLEYEGNPFNFVILMPPEVFDLFLDALRRNKCDISQLLQKRDDIRRTAPLHDVPSFNDLGVMRRMLALYDQEGLSKVALARNVYGETPHNVIFRNKNKHYSENEALAWEYWIRFLKKNNISLNQATDRKKDLQIESLSYAVMLANTKGLQDTLDIVDDKTALCIAEQDSRGYTPLYWAAYIKNQKILPMLINVAQKYKVDLSQALKIKHHTSRNGQQDYISPLRIAFEKQNFATASTLIHLLEQKEMVSELYTLNPEVTYLPFADRNSALMAIGTTPPLGTFVLDDVCKYTDNEEKRLKIAERLLLLGVVPSLHQKRNPRIEEAMHNVSATQFQGVSNRAIQALKKCITMRNKRTFMEKIRDFRSGHSCGDLSFDMAGQDRMRNNLYLQTKRDIRNFQTLTDTLLAIRRVKQWESVYPNIWQSYEAHNAEWRYTMMRDRKHPFLKNFEIKKHRGILPLKDLCLKKLAFFDEDFKQYWVAYPHTTCRASILNRHGDSHNALHRFAYSLTPQKKASLLQPLEQFVEPNNDESFVTPGALSVAGLIGKGNI